MKKNFLILLLLLINVCIHFIPEKYAITYFDFSNNDILYVTDPIRIEEIKIALEDTKTLQQSSTEVLSDQNLYESNNNLKVTGQIHQDQEISYIYYESLNNLVTSKKIYTDDQYLGYSKDINGQEYYFDNEQNHETFENTNTSVLTSDQVDQNIEYLIN